MVRTVVASNTASRADSGNMLIDYLAKGRSLDSLEEKNDDQLSAGLTMERRSRCSLPDDDSQFRQAC